MTTHNPVFLLAGLFTISLCPTVFSADPVLGTGSGLVATYYANETLSGDPALSRLDAQVNFDWAGGSPDELIPVDHFSVRWAGDIQPRYSEDYTITARTDDGVRVWIDNTLVIDSWIPRSVADSNYTFTAVAGQRYAIRMEYYERTGSAVAKLLWKSASEPAGIIPANQLYPNQVFGNGTGLLAGYFPGPSFTGTPTIRLDPTVNFSWPTTPIEGFPADHFSARWQGYITPKTVEPTTLILSTDDGVRLWIDESLVINDWTSHGTKEYRYILPTGITPHAIRLDYFEDTGSAVAKLQWESASVVKEIVPSTQLSPATSILTPASSTGSGLSAAYFPNENFVGTPWVRRDRTLDFNWGNGVPDPTMPADHFSVRWTGKIQTRFGEPYDLILTADDGVRVWVDNVEVINDWIPTSPKERRCTIPGGAGSLYALRVEYFERTGGAMARLEWESASESRQVVPESCLYPNDLDVVLPSVSFTSPVFIEGIHQAGLDVDAGNAPITLLGESRFAVNLPLSAISNTTARITAGSSVVTGTIAWAATTLSGTKTLVVRPGDSLLFSAPEPGTWAISLECGPFSDLKTIGNGENAPVTFSMPGHYCVTFYSSNSIEIGRSYITVPDVLNGDEHVPCSVNYNRVKDIFTRNASDKDILSISSSDSWISTSIGQPPLGAAPNVLRIAVMPTANARGFVLSRINGPSGPVLAKWPVLPFELQSTGEKYVGVDAVLPDGSMICNATLLLNPIVPDISVKLYAYVSGVTFDDSTTVRWLSSGNFIPQGGVGKYAFKLISAPGITTGVCHWMVAYDHDIQISK